ncbi:Lrp/AsnC family transcriptional regulator [Clostridium sp. OS1-26]|uniref:Lrp/AsnC family transcriptional regulator n=1 Tax=Clostridium sp. OS1-26 TaxID=3070681 RepID=UPI0027E1F25C|nr:Lrp/AsnC family transcriptional regulator [Clostridium sp. OS1-26]WML34676.1 Lrp/AsnC family transcriptional regulator [Clostridium sp. OS1-26]
MKSLQLDRTDYMILEILESNSRIPLVDIAAQVNMSPPAVKERMTKLEEANIIKGYTIKIQEKENFIETYIMIKTSKCLQLEDYCRNFKFVKEMKRVSGNYNYLLKLKTETINELYQFQEELVKFGPSNAFVVTKNIDLKEAKQAF